MKINLKKKRRPPRHFIPNILTLFNMFLGFLAIGLILNNHPIKAGVFIIIAGLFDVFDGKIARILGISSRFGVEFDSMADTVSFCVVPSILVYSLYVDGLPPLLGGFISFIPLMFGTIRLAKFNLDEEPGKPKSYTVGLTTPIATITLFSYLFFNHQIDGDFGDPRTALMLVAGLSFLMISPIHFAKFPLFSFKSGRTNTILLLAFIFSMIVLAIWQGFILMPLIAVYIGWNIIHWLINPSRNDAPSDADI